MALSIDLACVPAMNTLPTRPYERRHEVSVDAAREVDRRPAQLRTVPDLRLALLTLTGWRQIEGASRG